MWVVAASLCHVVTLQAPKSQPQDGPNKLNFVVSMVCVVCDNCVTRNEKIDLGQRLRKH